ncbi:MAG: transcription termination/antitermination protein NusG [Pikeienuella sp.]
MKHLEKGDPWPFRSVRGLTGSPIASTWYALITAPQKEAKTKKHLERAGVSVKYPTIDKVRHHHGKRYDYTVPMISQIIYAEFRYEPHWDVMRDRRVITGVFTNGGDPIPLSSDDVGRVMGLPTEAERIQAALIEVTRPKVGERAEITEGPFSGFFVDVTRVYAGQVWYEMLSGIKGQADERIVRRVVG